MKKDCCFIRARQPDQKAQRREQILAAAAELLATQGFEQVSLNAIARQARVAKSNIYRYFESREDIYLQLLQDDARVWIQAVELMLEPFANSDDVEHVVSLLSEQIVAAPRMCQLVSVLGNVLEQNLSEDVLFKFKLEFVQMGLRLVRSVHAALPGMKQPNLLPAVHTIIAVIAGLWPLGNPSPIVEKVMSRPELIAFEIRFETALAHALRLIIRGAYEG